MNFMRDIFGFGKWLVDGVFDKIYGKQAKYEKRFKEFAEKNNFFTFKTIDEVKTDTLKKVMEDSVSDEHVNAEQNNGEQDTKNSTKTVERKIYFPKEFNNFILPFDKYKKLDPVTRGDITLYLNLIIPHNSASIITTKERFLRHIELIEKEELPYAYLPYEDDEIRALLIKPKESDKFTIPTEEEFKYAQIANNVGSIYGSYEYGLKSISLHPIPGLFEALTKLKFNVSTDLLGTVLTVTF